MPLFNDEVKLSVASHPGFISGKYYASSSYNPFSSLTLIAGAIYYTYFFIPFDSSFSAISFQLTNAGGINQKARLAIYNIKNGLPFSLIKDFGEFSNLNTSGIKEIASSFSLSAGWYAISISTNVAGAFLACPSTSFSDLIGASAIGSILSGYRATAAYGVPPDTASVSAITTTISPVFWLKTA